MPPGTSWSQALTMTIFYGPQATSQLVAERQESLRSEVAAERRAAELRRAKRATRRSVRNVRWWTFRHPHPRPAAAIHARPCI